MEKQLIIDALITQLRQTAAHNTAVQVAPTAVLWTDKECQWQAAMPVIKQSLPDLIELGDFQPEQRIGPAIWIKCAIAGLTEELKLTQGTVPIIYLPGVCRKDLRAIDSCPEHLKPLAELQYRGCWWAYNTTGRDWSVSAFLTNERVGLSLDIAKDKNTQEAIIAILDELLESQIDTLTGKHLVANDFHALVLGDPIKDLLGWLNDASSKRVQWPANKWTVFCGHCQNEYGFDPNDGVPDNLLSQFCAAEQSWEPVWQRFEDTAHHLPDLVEQLSSVYREGLIDEPSHFLSYNVEREQALESELCALKDADTETVKIRIHALETEHAKRRDWLWHRLGFSPCASILQALAKTVEHTSIPFSGLDPESMATSYEERFWQADAAALQAMALCNEAKQQQIVADILALIYTPWLETTTLEFQDLVRLKGYPCLGHVSVTEKSDEVTSQVVFFVDGLRFDTAQLLMEKLQGMNAKSNLETQWAALPSLTATAKAAVTPVAHLFTGLQENDDFIPVLSSNKSKLGSHHFKKALFESNWQYLEGLDAGEPEQGLAWIQMGDLDHMGHAQQRKMPLGVDAVLEEVAERVKGLIQAGWQHIRIVTDHGWLWVPNQLPKADIPKTAVKKRLSRCAILKDNVDTGHLKVQWHWNKNVTIAMAPGISGFQAGDYYNHGGVSLQECLTPVINVTAD